MSTVPPSHDIHPFLRGNFAPVEEEYISYPCAVVYGSIPKELLGGQYIRNGGNPVYPPEKGRHYHWFDGDGMLHGVLFPSRSDAPPLYTNRHLATPLLTLTLILLRSPIPSIALLISPLSSLHRILSGIIQAFLYAFRARLGVVSVANTSVIWWGQGLGREAEDEAEVEECMDMLGTEDKRPRGLYRKDHRLLATCESGPPLEVRVPELETVGWDRLEDPVTGESLAVRRGYRAWWRKWTMPNVQEDWMTAHPRIDPVDGSLLFYDTQMFDAPHARYSVIDRNGDHLVWKEGVEVGQAKMMHDFAASRTHTILLNLPLTIGASNLFSFPPVPFIHFNRNLPSEFVVFPRLLRSAETPQEPVRFIEVEPSLIFHTANAWDEYENGEVSAVHMLGCRFKSAQLVYSAGQVEIPKAERIAGENDTVRLHYYRFLLPRGYAANQHITDQGIITHSFPLSAIPFEFPTMPPELGMSAARYVYGCTMKSGSFDERLGGAAKVDCLAKIDVLELSQRGRDKGIQKSLSPVDGRNSAQIIRDSRRGLKGPVQIFDLPDGWYAQEPRFVPRKGQGLDEDDGYLLTYVYDEQYLLADGTPSVGAHAGSELWVVDAKRMGDGMSALVCRVKLPQRVPYGLHGTWVAPALSRQQRPLTAVLKPQELLQDKLALSRLRYFASIIFSRPSSREKSQFERAVLALLWPSAVGFLALALSEGAASVLGRFRGVDVRSSEDLSGNWTRPGVHETARTSAPVPWVQLIVASLVLFTFVFQRRSSPKREPSPPLQDL